jgi:sirohydrochlorin ferrochelatase
MVGSIGAETATRDETAVPPLRLVAVTHGSPSPANRAAVIRLVDGVATARPELDVSISFVDARSTDVASAVAGDAATPGAAIVPLVLSAGFHVRTGLALGLDRIGGSSGLAAELGPDPRIVEVLADRLEAVGLTDRDAILLAAAGSNDPRAARECFETARLLAQRLSRPVTVGFIAAGLPRLPDAIEMVREVHPGARIVVGAYLLAPGAFYDMAAALGGDVIAEPLLLPDRAAPAPLVELVLDRYTAVELGGRHGQVAGSS